jgi:glycosyltransferase involved in cell wall biosynthesis
VRIDQVLPCLASRDAIGVHTVALCDALRAAGFDSDIFYGSSTPDFAHLGQPIVDLGRTGRNRWLLYQAAIGSPVFDVLAARSEPKLVNYHNIAPAPLFHGWAPELCYELELGRAQLEWLAPETRFAVADSAYNESELLAAGYKETAVVPLLIDMSGSASESPETSDRLLRGKAAGGADLLFVGKVSPHKAPHDLVKMLAVLRRLYDPLARLHLVGTPLGERYQEALLAFIDDLGLADAVFVTGSVDIAQLESYYRAADVFVCASEHEGFCVPLIEAMGHGVPVVAYGVAAIPETVAGAGLVLAHKDPLLFASAVARVLDDEDLRAELRRAGTARLADFSLERSRPRFVDLLTQAVGAG